MGYTERSEYGSSFTWHQPCNNQTALLSTPLRWVLEEEKREEEKAIKSYSRSCRITCDKQLYESDQQPRVRTVSQQMLLGHCFRDFFSALLLKHVASHWRGLQLFNIVLAVADGIFGACGRAIHLFPSFPVLNKPYGFCGR